MFVGHYAVSLALKKVERKASLGALFLAVQLVDILFFPFVLLGIEKTNIVENVTPSTHFELVFMPYTHSLAASLMWAGVTYIACRLLPPRIHSVALAMALAVLSHWFLDLIVHTPDLPLWSDASPKMGLGLWRSAIATSIVDAALLVCGLWLYLRSTTATSPIGKYGMGVFVLILILLNAVNLFGPPIYESKLALATSSLAMYFAFAAVAYWLNGKRS